MSTLLVFLCHCMRDKLKKCKREKKRPSVDWVNTIRCLDDEVIYAHYVSFIKKHPLMSANRCAWNVLKKYYSTTSLSEYRHYGFPLMDVDRIR